MVVGSSDQPLKARQACVRLTKVFGLPFVHLYAEGLEDWARQGGALVQGVDAASEAG